MTVLIVGRPDSGKSRRAEDMVMSLPGKHRYYVATMQVADAASAGRVERHRRMREGKGFVTLEIPFDVNKAIECIKDPEQSIVLLECISNLAGNEMYDNPDRARPGNVSDQDIWVRETADGIVSDIKALADAVQDLIIVANRFETDDEGYDDETVLYVRLNNAVNDRIAGFADRVIDMLPGSKVICP